MARSTNWDGKMRTWVAAACICLVTAAVAAAPANALTFGIESGSFTADSLTATDVPETQAGIHPNKSTVAMRFNLQPDGGMTVDRVKDVFVDVPAGLVGNPQAAPFCPSGIFSQLSNADQACPAASQVGKVTLIEFPIAGFFLTPTLPVYNLAPVEGEAAAFGMSVAGVPIRLSATVRPETNTVRVGSRSISEALIIAGQTVTLWGVPSDSSHDTERVCDVNHPPDLDLGQAPGAAMCTYAIDYPRRPFLRNPTSCTSSTTSEVRASSWQNPSVFDFASYTPANPVSGCESVPFIPTIAARPTQTRRGDATGLAFDLSIPQPENPDGLESSDLEDSVVTLPAGLTLNPSSAGGLAGCSDEQVGIGTDRDVECPDASKIGTVEVETPLLADGLTGDVYVGTPQPGNRYRIFLVAENRMRGISIRLEGRLALDEADGRITARFENNPQLPFSELRLRVKGGSRAPLANPRECGAHTTSAELTAWSGRVVTPLSAFSTSEDAGGCGPHGFAPQFGAGSTNAVAGGYSQFAASFSRSDADDELAAVAVNPPQGLLAKLSGVALCPDGDAAAGACPQASRVGGVDVAAGAGDTPLWVKGDVYLTGPYQNRDSVLPGTPGAEDPAPYGLAVVVDTNGQAGPYDLGKVVVRQSIHVDRETAELAVISDALPRILAGVPLRMRDVRVGVDRPGFVVNPTDCSPKQAAATLAAADGRRVGLVDRFQVADCAQLGFRPRLAMRLTGRKQRRTGGHPGLRAILTQGTRQANVKQAEVTLPRSIVLDARNSYDPKLLCDYDRARTGDCPASSIIGKATANTPLLARPLSGKVHLVQGIKFGPRGNRIRTTPALLVKLRGEVAIDLRARTTARNGRLVTAFPRLPDAPVSKFALDIRGGKKGILVVTRTARAKIDICDARQIADVETDGHSGRQATFTSRIKAPCSKRRSTARRAR